MHNPHLRHLSCSSGPAGAGAGSGHEAGGTFPGGNQAPVLNLCMHFAKHPLAVSSQRDFSYLPIAQRGD